VAKAIATVGGIAIAPGVSRNRRLYTAEAIAGAVARAQARIGSGEQIILREDGPEVTSHVMTQLTHHAAEDDSTKIVGRVTSMKLDDQGRARFTAEIADTDAGRNIASLLDTTDGQPPFLRGVSVRGQWVGTTRLVKGPDGDPVETGDDLEFIGLDYTHKPGVPAATVDTFAWTGGGQRSETTAPVLITESVQEALVAITEEATPDLGVAAIEPPFHVLEDGACVTCGLAEAATPMSKRASGTQGTGGPYADPGYQKDKKQRYQLDTRAHAKAAWSYISMPKNAKAYSAAQLKRIKGRIKAALKKFGVTISESAGWTVDAPIALDVAIAEHYGDPDSCGSYSIRASNGPTNICIDGYGLDPAELDVILQAAVSGAVAALAALDPDMDGDIDVAGAPNADGDDDFGTLGTESAPDEDDPADAGETDEADPAESGEVPAPQAAAGETTEGDPVMAESTSAAAETAPAAATSYTQADLDAAVERGIAAERARRKAAKANRKPTETAPAAPVTEAAPAAPVAEAEDAMIARLVEAKLAAQFPQETAEARLERIVSERFDAAVAQRIQSGQVDPSRKGLVVKEAVDTELDPVYGTPTSWGKPLHKMSQEEFDKHTGPVIARHVLKDRADFLG
jgi:hypothetical protein